MSFLEPKIDDQKDMGEGPLFRYPRAEKRLQVTRSTAISSDFSDLKVGKVLESPRKILSRNMTQWNHSSHEGNELNHVTLPGPSPPHDVPGELKPCCHRNVFTESRSRPSSVLSGITGESDC